MAYAIACNNPTLVLIVGFCQLLSYLDLSISFLRRKKVRILQFHMPSELLRIFLVMSLSQKEFEIDHMLFPQFISLTVTFYKACQC